MNTHNRTVVIKTQSNNIAGITSRIFFIFLFFQLKNVKTFDSQSDPPNFKKVMHLKMAKLKHMLNNRTLPSFGVDY